MSNWTTVTEFLLLGFSDTQQLQILHFVTFLAVYLAALAGNLLVITLVTTDHHLHSPDVAQIFLFLLFCTAYFSFLTIMAYDRYIAICKPLHYEIIMNRRRACIQMVACAWVVGAINSAVHTGNTSSLLFCHSNIINQFFCEIPQLLKLSCFGTYLRELAAVAFTTFLALGCFAFIVVSYVQIFTVVWSIPSAQGRQKASSTCIPHLIVVSLLLSTTSIAYMKPVSDSPSPLDLLAAVLYCVVLPLMNPVIYSMRNREIQAALKQLLHRLIRSRNNMSIFLS